MKIRDIKMDGYAVFTKDKDELMDEVCRMEADSHWDSGVAGSGIAVFGIEPLEVPGVQADAKNGGGKYGFIANADSLDEATILDTANGCGLLVSYNYNLHAARDTAVSGLHETAKLYGSAFGRMDAHTHATVLQYGLNVAKTTNLVLQRCGKVSAVHSSSYEIMPISRLLQILDKELPSRFGECKFLRGTNGHALTTAMWSLNDAQQDILDRYQKALDSAGFPTIMPVAWMPAVYFESSDTALSAARAVPVFIDDAGCVSRFTEGVQIKHVKSAGGCGKFAEEVEKMWSLFDESMEKIADMAKVIVNHPANAFVGVCNKLQIPAKWAEKTRAFLDGYQVNGQQLSAHDIYVIATRIPKHAKELGAAETVIKSLTEQIGKMLDVEWKDYDVGGSVAWGNK